MNTRAAQLLRSIAQNEYMIDSHYLPDGQVLLDAAAELDDIPQDKRRHVCEVCGSRDIQTCVPAWFREGDKFESVLLDVDWEADHRHFCENCNEHVDVIDRAKGT